tara:strand:- start:4484 stop:5989 length:1506 start_codon:yes stop_codon:yes gene_type:complete
VSGWRQWLPLRRLAPRVLVRSKSGRRVPYILTPQQDRLLAELESGEDLLCLKPRQIGASTVVAYYFFWLWYTSPDPLTLVILSYKQRSSKHLLTMVRQFYDSLPVELRRPLAVDTTSAMVMEDSGAEVLAMGAQDDGGTRSFTAQYIWLSEFAFAPNGAELLSTTEGSIAPGGQVIAESTANHWGDALHDAMQSAERGVAPWRSLFFRWSDAAEYRRAPRPGEVLTEDELAYQRATGLDVEQLMWWRDKVGKIGEARARREFPLSPADAYTQAAGAFLAESLLAGLACHAAAESGRTIISEPIPGHVYVAGFDPAGGVGLDDSALTVLDITSGAVAAVWRSNNHGFDDALSMLADTVLRYDARVAIEYNNHGHGYFEAIRVGLAAPGVKLYTIEGKPVVTTPRSRALMWSGLRSAVESGDILEVDASTLADLRALAEDDIGRVVLPRTSAGHCDGAVALALAVLAARGLTPRRASRVDSMIQAGRAERVLRRSGGNLRRYR